MSSPALADGPTKPEQDLAAQIQCSQFKKTPDGGWKATADASVGGKNVGGKIFKSDGSKPEETMAAALDVKCAPKGKQD